MWDGGQSGTIEHDAFVLFFDISTTILQVA
jgi:hypothetical protein